jgi:hypothetical protein
MPLGRPPSCIGPTGITLSQIEDLIFLSGIFLSEDRRPDFSVRHFSVEPVSNRKIPDRKMATS